METLQTIMDAVMARQAIEDQADTFVRDIHRVAHRLAYGQEPECEDVILVQAADCYLRLLDAPVPAGFEA
jgi:hypothetical protein